jgi:processive 1,2-diacylglycerol beta-glucosyltransferase
MAVRRVLVLTAGFGEGHNAAARNLSAALKSSDPTLEVELRDIFAEAYGWINRAAIRIYLFIINRLPWLWEAAFNWLDRSGAAAERIGIFGRAARHLRTIIGTFRPDLVVSVYPGYNHLLDSIYKGEPQRPFRLITIVTDSITINRIWHTAHSDCFVVANEQTAAVMRAQGVESDRIRVVGFPVPAFFAEPRGPKTPPSRGEKWRVLLMVNSGRHLAMDVARRLVEEKGVALTVTVGRDVALEQRMRALGDITVYGWTSELPRLMADAHIVISKAGGATVQECLAAGTPMIVSQIVPGQEEGNARLIASAGAGRLALTVGSIAEGVREAIGNGGALWMTWHDAARHIGRPDAAREIAEWLLHGEEVQVLETQGRADA